MRHANRRAAWTVEDLLSDEGWISSWTTGRGGT